MESPAPKPVMQMWMAAIGSGYATREEWQAWADGVVVAMDNPPTWVLELCGQRDADELYKTLREIEGRSNLPIPWVDSHELYVGYRFAGLREHRLTLEQFCNEGWSQLEIDDTFSDWFPDVINQWLAGEPESKTPLDAYLESGRSPEELIAAFEAGRFPAWAAEAMEQYAYLMSRAAQDVCDGRAIPK
ncbi:MAG: hypothetical protein ACF8R7_01315 [Phycisphaerales bacterium JB039]